MTDTYAQCVQQPNATSTHKLAANESPNDKILIRKMLPFKWINIKFHFKICFLGVDCLQMCAISHVNDNSSAHTPINLEWKYGNKNGNERESDEQAGEKKNEWKASKIPTFRFVATCFSWNRNYIDNDVSHFAFDLFICLFLFQWFASISVIQIFNIFESTAFACTSCCVKKSIIKLEMDTDAVAGRSALLIYPRLSLL